MNLLRLYMTEIEQGLAELCDLVRKQAQPEGAVMFSIPQITKEDETRLIADDYDTIPVTVLHGQDAIEQCINAYKDMYVTDDAMSRRFVNKFPGLVPLSCTWQTLAPVLEAVNQAKLQFKTEVQKYENAEEKWFEVHDRFHYLITTMAYRKIYAFDGDHKAFYFNWSRRQRVETKSAEEWIDRLDKARYTIPSSHTKSSWYALVDQEQKIVANCGAEKLSMRRPIKLRPECSVRDLENRMTGYSAGLPFLLTGHTSRPKITALPDYKRKKASTSSGKWQLVVPRVHLYCGSLTV